MNVELYNLIDKIAVKYFSDLELYLNTVSGKGGYYNFISRQFNELEFSIGSRRFILSKYINLKEQKCCLRLKQIVPNNNDFGKFILEDLSSHNFDSSEYGEFFLNNSEIRMQFPEGYLKKIENDFQEI